MEFDHPHASAPDWSFPSPGATPTNSNFTHNVFHTPKTANFPSHFFQDAFSTPQMPGYATPRQPEYATLTPLQRYQMPSDGPHQQIYPNSSTAPVMAPPGPATSPNYADPNALPMPGTAMSFDTSQMQTPPPTRGTSARKPTPQQVAFGTPSTIASRRFMTPQPSMPVNQPVSGQQQPPIPFPQLQFTPDVYQFGNFGPASAPVFPQTQLLWDQTASPVMYNQQQMLDDPFVPTGSSELQWSTAPVQHNNIQPLSFNTPAMGGLPVQPPLQRPTSAAPAPSTQPYLSPPVMTSAGVDPSLVYSSPIRPIQSSSSRTSKPRSAVPKADVRRRDSGRAQHQRTETVLSTESVSASAPKELRRSNTTGSARPQSALSTTSGESFSRSNNPLQLPRTTSPLKRVGKLPLGSIFESKPRSRPSVVLTVDETGRARTETRPIDDYPTRCLRTRYPGLFDSDSSDQESEEEDQTPSRSASFSFARGEERKSKAAKLDPPVEYLEGLTILRSSSSASMRVTPSRAAIAAAAQLRREGSIRRQTPSRNGQRRVGSSTTTSIDTCPMDMSMDRRHSMLGTQDYSQGQDWADVSLNAHNRRWSIMSQEQLQNISPTHQYSEQPTMHVTHQIRCSCGVPGGQGQSLVQCISCTQWSHTSCSGLNPSALPPTFICFLCTKPTTSLQLSKSGNRKRL